MESSKPIIAVYVHGVPGAAGLSKSLSEHGATVLSVDCDPISRGGASAAFSKVLDTVDGVAISVAAADHGHARPLVQWSADDWRRCADEAQFALLEVLQGLHDALAGRSCPVVLIGATVGMTGAANHAALATATEGQRGLMKALARQWGPQMRFIWLSVSTPLLFPAISLDELPEQCELGDYTPSLGVRPGWDDVARSVLMLASPYSVGITGQTLIVDGGEWMLP